jgi:glycosyltransferase involved in cell wall biosynthesis
MIFSVIIPVYNAEETLPDLLNSLKSQEYSSHFEIIIIDDCSTDNSIKITQNFDVLLIALENNSGPAVCRNIGAQKAQGDILVFTDSDCQVAETWLSNIEREFHDKETEAIMGRLIIPTSNYLGDSISALGFPAGGSIGFDKIWRVDINGFTDSLSTCNCAIKKDIFEQIEGFDETFPYPGGEDTLLAYAIRQNGYHIKYCPDIIVNHAPRTKFKDFLRWQFRRGISSYLFAQKIMIKSDFIKLRLWSIRNIISTYKFDKKIPLILILLLTGYFSQVLGYLLTIINHPTSKQNK